VTMRCRLIRKKGLERRKASVRCKREEMRSPRLVEKVKLFHSLHRHDTDCFANSSWIDNRCSC
jgi:hypothetical protein